MEPIEQAGWKPALWLGLDWRLTTLLLFGVLASLMTHWPVFILVVCVLEVAIYMWAFLPLADREPILLDLWTNTRVFWNPFDRMASAWRPAPNYPSEQRL
jgi:hypothetical protein